jgi:uncharacterized protein YbjT (DUF2867 family)
VLCGTRDPDRANRDDPANHYVKFDLGDPDLVLRALRGVTCAVYLAHAMDEDGKYEDRERAQATLFRDAAKEAGVSRIVYLGGMRPRGRPSRHLESRLNTGEILRSGVVPTAELQATMIIGGGSESFRIVRDLAARLPFMLLPRWLESESQPVAIADVVLALVHAASMPLGESRIYTLPGPLTLSGKDIILTTARLLGQRPKVIEVPFVTPRLSSYWIRLVTRAKPRLARELVEGLRSDIVAHERQLWDEMPGVTRTPFEEAVRIALAAEERTMPFFSRWVERGLHRIARAPAQR